jgi:subtilisin family serine protease
LTEKNLLKVLMPVSTRPSEKPMSLKYHLVFFVLLFSIPVPLQTLSPSEAFAGAPEKLQSMANDTRLVNSTQLLAPFQTPAQEIRVIVSLNESIQAKKLVSAKSKRKTSQKGNIVYNLHDQRIKILLRETVSNSLSAFMTRIDSPNIRIQKTFHYTFGFAATVTADGLEELLSQPDVISISEDIPLKAHTNQGISLMNSLAPRNIYDGSGIAIAIVDTGIDTSHPRLGNSGTFPNTKVIGGYDFGDNDPDPRPNTSGEAHGTACAGIAAGDIDTTGDYIGGVAPGAKLYALKITAGDGDTADASSLISALEWCLTHQYDAPNNPILIINTSFGGGRYFSTCDNTVPDMTQAATNAISAGISIFVSSGNEGYCDSLAWPACISNVNAVGAVYDSAFGNYSPCIASTSCAEKIFTTGCGDYDYYAIDSTVSDGVPSYSNSASFLTLFAPSNMAYTTDITGTGGYSSTDYITGFGGTSAASPYAAGAAAVLQHAAKVNTGTYLQPGQVQYYLSQYGDSVTDGKVAITKPRINLGNAVNQLPVGTTYTITASSEPNGKITPSGPVIVAEYDEQAFTIEADPHYRIQDVMVDDSSIGAVGSYTFYSIIANHSISASFERLPAKPFPWFLIIRSIIASQGR